MARSRGQTFPSAGVLVAAIVAALLAVVLMQLYISSQVASVKGSAFEVLQLTADLPAGEPIRGSHIREVEVPSAFEEAFERALKSNEKHLVLNKEAPRQMYAGEVLYAPTFMIDADTLRDMVNVRKGFELVSIPVDKDTSVRGQLQPGSYVNIRAVFDKDPEPREEDLETLEVLSAVRVATIDGSTLPLPPRSQGKYEQVGIELKPDQVTLLLQVMNVMHEKEFMLTMPNQPDVDLRVEPKVNPLVVDKYIREGAATGTGAGLPFP
jgi:Flp pilus assembly protein CpaB